MAGEAAAGAHDERVVVLDLGNVLIPWDRRWLFAEFFADPQELDRFVEEVFTLSVNLELDRGRPSVEVLEELAARHPEHREAITCYVERFRETLGPAIDGSVDILDRLLATGRRVYALSNWSAETFHAVRGDYPFLDRFTGRVISGEVGLVKPDAEVFHHLCETFGFRPQQATFVDDSEVNVVAAERLGFDAVLFTSPEALEAALVERGLLSAGRRAGPT